MSEFASLKSEKWWEAPCCMINPLLHPADVMVLRTSAKQYKKLELGVSLLALLQKAQVMGKLLWEMINKSLVDSWRRSKITYSRKHSEQGQ